MELLKDSLSPVYGPKITSNTLYICQLLLLVHG
jgi:hypothetical protein